MNVKEIYVSVKFVKNLGNYQSFAAEGGVTAEIEPGEKAEDAFASAWSMAQEQVRNQINGLKNNQEVR